MYSIFLLILLCIFLYIIFKGGKCQADVSLSRYEELLKREEWRDKRLKILKRDNYTCQWCGRHVDLNVHHKYYSKHPNGQMVTPWNYPDEALITLCDMCHKKAHNKKIKTYYRKSGENY